MTQMRQDFHRCLSVLISLICVICVLFGREWTLRGSEPEAHPPPAENPPTLQISA